MPGGRPRLPDEVKKARGTFRPGRAVNTTPEPAVNDPDGVYAEFAGIAEAAKADGSVDALRHAREVAKVCRADGYAVHWNPLPLIMGLSELEIEASAVERRKLRAEIRAIYADIKPSGR